MSGSGLSSPFLKTITLLPDEAAWDRFPFDRFGFLKTKDFKLDFPMPVTFFIGENGTGKSTLLEAIAKLCGFHLGGGGSGHQLHHTSDSTESPLADALRPSWLPKVSNGFFFRADTFADVARYLDDEGDLEIHGGRRLHDRSHGESLLAVFADRFKTSERCMYLLDEPENALSPTRQMTFLRLLSDWEQSGNAQMIVATHSPIIMSYPSATILSFDGESIESIEYEETEHYRITKAFLGNPERYLAELFDDAQES